VIAERNAGRGSEHRCQTGCERSGTVTYRLSSKRYVMRMRIPRERDTHYCTTRNTARGQPSAARKAGTGGREPSGTCPGDLYRENSIVDAVDTPRCRIQAPLRRDLGARQREEPDATAAPSKVGAGAPRNAPRFQGPPRSGNTTLGVPCVTEPDAAPPADLARDPPTTARWHGWR